MEQKVLQGLIGEDIKLDNFENKETVLLNSPGGDLYTGFSMYDYNKSSNIDIGIVGVCGSAATIALLGSKTRWGTPNSRYLIHNPSLSLEGFASEFEEAAVMLRAETERILDIYEAHLNGSRDDIRAWMNEEKLWDAKTALERNLITNIKDIDFASRVPEGSNINNLFTNFKMSIKMKEEDKQNLSGIETKLDKILNNFKSFFAPKNIMVQDVNGIEIDFADVATKEEIADGAVGTVDGQLASEDYVMPDGSTYSFEDGVLTIKPAEAEDVEALKAENAALKEELASVQNSVSKKDKEVSNLTKSLKDMSVQVTEVSKELTNFKNQFSEDSAGVNTPPENGEGKTKFTYKKK